MKWQIVPDAKEEMIRSAYKGGRGGHRGSSAPSSPSQLNYITQGPKDMAAKDPGSARKRKASPSGSPPPISSALRPSQSTPDRGHASAMEKPSQGADDSPLPRPRRGPPRSSVPHSDVQPQSPTLTSSYLQDDGASFVTPAPHRVHPKLAPPSTAQRPSQHMPTSSPAPFWKYADIGSTPLKPVGHFDFSPTKNKHAPPQSSSPPHGSNKSPIPSPSRPRGPEPPKEAASVTDEDDEQGFDLAK
jgi:forkhead protein FKH